VPDWHETRLPLHFIVTGLAQGLSMVLLIAALLRWGLRLAHIDDRDLDLLAKLSLASALAAGYLYLDEIAAAYLSAPIQRSATFTRVLGEYAGYYWVAVTFTVLIPQLLWMRAARRSVLAAILVGVSISAGVWFDRFSIIVGGLQRDYLPSFGRGYAPTLLETGLFFGTVGLFATLVLLFARTIPAVSMFESRHDEREERA
jgi:molybdopterin-containing oxidoreductase family membrane subunit